LISNRETNYLRDRMMHLRIFLGVCVAELANGSMVGPRDTDRDLVIKVQAGGGFVHNLYVVSEVRRPEAVLETYEPV
jgi:hypothetical protein